MGIRGRVSHVYCSCDHGLQRFPVSAALEKQSNIPADQADAFAAAFEEGLEKDTISLATKDDLEQTVDKTELMEFKVEIISRISSLDSRISSLDSRISGLEGKFTILLWGLGLGGAAIISLLVSILSRLPS